MFSSSTYRILPYAIVVLLGYIGFALPLPILPEMFLDPERSILPASYSLSTRSLLLGFFMASYPLGQFIGAPLLGKLSDAWGRKKIILYSLCCTTVGYVITALGCASASLWIIFSGLFLCGFCEGNVAIAQSVIADITEKENKAYHFGWINIFISLGFIIGPLAGGKLADPNFVSFFTFATPFWGAALMTVLGVLIIFFTSKETLKVRKKEKYRFFEPFIVIFQSAELRVYYLANFFLALGFFSFFRFMPVYFERIFDFSISELAYIIVYDSIWIVIAILFLVGRLAKRFSPKALAAWFSIFLGVFLVILTLPNTAISALWTIPPIGICFALAATNGSVLVSNSVREDFHGGAMGSLQSAQVLAEILTGALGGIVAASLPACPLYVGSLMAVISGVILLAYKKKIFVNVEKKEQVCCKDQ